MKSFKIESVDKQNLASQLQDKIDNLNKPKGSLGKLEKLALQIGLIQNTLSPKLNHQCHALFAADHGIEREGVSVSPREVTWQQLLNFCRGGGGVNMFCHQHDFFLRLIDVGVDHDFPADIIDPEHYDNLRVEFPIYNHKIAYGTKNFRYEAAMSQEEFDQAIEVGVQHVNDSVAAGCNVISFGEMGIGNTSPSSIWMYFFENIPLDKCVGAGAGLNSEGIQHKYAILAESIENFQRQTGIESITPLKAPEDWQFVPGRVERQFFPAYAEEIIRWFGGFEMVAAIGGMLQAAEKRMVILVDGFIMTACMLAASQLYPAVLDYAIFAHQGDESGHRMMLQAMDADPILHLDLRLGEGTGALCAFPIVRSAVNMINEMNNFQNANITKYF